MDSEEQILSAVGHSTPRRARRAADLDPKLERRPAAPSGRGRSACARSFYPRVCSPRPSLVAWERKLTDAPRLESVLPSRLLSEFESSDCWALLESDAPLPLSSEFESVACWPWLESVAPSL